MNIAPLIDVVFLLLLFFIVASTLDINEIRATIQLPQTDEQMFRENRTPITLYLDKNGLIYVGKKNISWEILPDYLKEEYKDLSKSIIEVYADKEVHFEYIARIMVMGSRLEIDKIDFLLKQKY